MDVLQIVQEALSIPSAVDRRQFLDRTCQGQPELRQRVDQALSSQQPGRRTIAEPQDPTLQNPPGAAAATVLSDSPPPSAAPTRVEPKNAALRETATASPSAGQITARLSGRFGRYEIRRLLGAGAMGEVYLAFDGELRREVALKIPQFGKGATDDLVTRFRNEARAAATLHHPNLCPVYDVGEIEGRHFLTMAYIQGRPLSDFIRPEKRQSLRTVAALVRKLALALAEAHRRRVVHRDLKPANIMIDSRNEPIVMDFGLAYQADEGGNRLTRTGYILGTPAYMSPEQISGDPERIGPAADIWALGVILYELLAGQLPFDGPGLDVIGKIQHIEPAPLQTLRDDVPDVLADICRKMLSKNVDGRFQSMEEVALALAAFIKAHAAGAGVERPAAAPEDEWSDPESLPHPANGRSVRTEIPGRSRAASRTRKERPGVTGRALPGSSKQLPTWAIPTAVGIVVVLLLGVTLRNFAGSRRPSPADRSTADKAGSPPENADPLLTPAAGGAGEAPAPPEPIVVDTSGWQKWPKAAPAPAVAPFSEKQAKEFQEAWASYLKVPVEWENSVGIKFRLIPPGEFEMGSSPEEVQEALKLIPKMTQGDEIRASTTTTMFQSEAPRHRVILTKPFYFAVTETTRSQYERMGGTRLNLMTNFGHGRPAHVVPSLPVISPEWNQLDALISRFSRTEITDGPTLRDAYRLPTEAQWEFACRAGTTTRYWGGDSPADLARTDIVPPKSTELDIAGTTPPNPFGLCDLHGNAGEMCSDYWSSKSYEEFAQQPAVDPTGPKRPETFEKMFDNEFNRDLRVVRGASIYSWPEMCRSAARSGLGSGAGTHPNGFRLAIGVDAVRWILSHPKPKAPAVSRTIRLDLETEDNESIDVLVSSRLPYGKQNEVGQFRVKAPGGIDVPAPPETNYSLDVWQLAISTPAHPKLLLMAPAREQKIKLWKKRFAVVEYAWNPTGSRELSGTGVITGKIVLPHYGQIPSLPSDWQMVQERETARDLGPDLSIRFHRMSYDGGLNIPAIGAAYDKLDVAPSPDKVGETYPYKPAMTKVSPGMILFYRVQGDPGKWVYGKLRVIDISNEAPRDVELSDRGENF